MHAAAEFIRHWFEGSTGRVYLASLPNPELKGTPEGEPNERHVLTRSSEQTAGFTAKWDRAGRAVYWGPATLKPAASERIKENIENLIALHIDIDFKNIVEPPEEVERIVENLPLLPTCLRHTGHGLQAFWRYKTPVAATPETIAEHERLQRLLANYLGGDQAACDACHLMRMPGTTNSKNGDSIPVRELAARPEALYTREEFQAWLESATPVIHRKGDAGNGSSPDNPFEALAKELGAGKAPLDVDQAFAEMIYLGPGGGGTAHDTLLRCSAALIARGEAPEAVIARALGELCQAAARSGTPFNPEREREHIRQLVEGAVAKDFGRRHAEEVGNEPENDADKEIDPLADFCFDGTVPIEPEPTLIDGLLSTTGLTLIGGQSSAGKSFLAITMAVCLAEKKPFFGREVRERVGTLYIAGEGQGAIAARFAAAKNAAGIALERRLPVAWLDVPPSLESAPKITAFITKLRALDAKFRQEHGVRLGAVIIDTASACFDLKDENDNAEVTRICKIMQRVGAGFGGVAVPVHHYGKVLEAGPRGASAWRGHVEIILGALADIDPLTGAPSDRALVIAKSRDGIQGPVAPFTLEFIPLGVDKDGKEFGACVVRPELEGEVQFGGMKRRKASRSETALREAISGALNENGVNRTFRGRNVHAVSAEHVRLEFNRRYVVTEEDPLRAARAKRVAFNRALAQLPAEFGMGEFEGTQWIWRV